ncbi:hypothetical protein HYE53_04985 [Aggregatibacter actinomycetemcomitans]|uniref:hypothetical protein n=1 Tax=Aggregatibacter actinomycetemcomitans TaxID=714 RepID=UPI00197BF2A1|nr:hypothetical protein [Aggregatibacter actinomycetemcomitans]MBN6070448.1 hypothetical protein [Aggregatibacter actinomycetemcomitans]
MRYVAEPEQRESGFSRTRYRIVVGNGIKLGALSISRIFQQQTSEAILRTLLQKNQVAHMAFYLLEG